MRKWNRLFLGAILFMILLSTVPGDGESWARAIWITWGAILVFLFVALDD